MTVTSPTKAKGRGNLAQGRKLTAAPQLAAALDDARGAGLLDGEKTLTSPLALPKALVEAAKRESGIDSPTDLGILALATLAQPDPVAAFLKRTHGRLGASHTLEL